MNTNRTAIVGVIALSLAIAPPAGGLLAVVAVLAGPTAASAATVTLANSDALGTSSFNSAGNWDNGLPPTNGNSYVTITNLLRTPATTNSSYSFQGDALTVNNSNAFIGATGPVLGSGLILKGVGTNTYTVSHLIADGGWIRHGSGDGDTMYIEGGATVTTNGLTFDLQGPLIVDSTIGGAGTIIVRSANSSS